MDTGGIPFPDDAPEPRSCVRVERPESGVARLVLDPPHRKLAVFDLALMRDLELALIEIERDSELEGLVITGREPLSFAAGADLDVLGSITDAGQGEVLARAGQGLFERVAALGRRGVRTVAAVGGPVPGGAYEICLACRFIVAAQHRSTRIGLPETQLGILPGWGGTQRLPRRVGVPKALDAILTGRLLDAKRAKRLGLVDRLTHPEYLERVALDLAAGRESLAGASRGVAGILIDRNPLATAIIGRQAEKAVLAKTRGHYPAPLRALKLTLAAPRTPLERGLHSEARALGELAATAVCKNLVTIFHLSEEAKKLGKSDAGTRDVRRAGVLGAGIMGGGIAGLLADKDVDVRLRDLSQAALDEAVAAHRARVGRRLRRRRLEKYQAVRAIDRLEASTEPTGFARCDFVIEAVAERLEVKQAVFGDLAKVLGPQAILATNTSSLSVSAIAEVIPHPERVVGMHFFNPVHAMPLVEIVRGERTSDEVVTTTARLALKLGKTPVIVKDVAGFLVNRLLGPYLDEAVRLFEAGADPRQIETAAKQFGMPMGPLELLDEVGFDIASHAGAALHAAYGERMAPTGVLARMMEDGRLGKKNRRGFYDHPEIPEGSDPKKAPKKTLSTDLSRFVEPDLSRGQDFGDQWIVDCLVLAMLNEAAFALEEDVVAGPRELDLATVFGMGFPPFRGGLLRFADTLGASEIVARLRRIASAPDVLRRAGGANRFAPASSLVQMAETNTRFHASS